MRNGRAPRRRAGFTYVAMLLAVAAMGVGLAATGMVWSQSRQREKEQELMFVGDQFRQAIASYYERSPGGLKQYPKSLEDLLEDKRYPNPQRYLRKIYADPLTGKPEWGLMAGPGGTITGVYSLSNATPIKSAGFLRNNRTFQGATTYQEWRFFYEPPQAAPPVLAAPKAAAGSPAQGSASMPAASPFGAQDAAPSARSAAPAVPVPR